MIRTETGKGEMKYTRNGEVTACKSVTAMATNTWDNSELAGKKEERWSHL